MKVWEALELLNSLDKTMDVTLIFGGSINVPKFNNPMPTPQYPMWTTPVPNTGTPYFPDPYPVTCKTVQ